MTASLFSIISYVLISTFTPGPSNISSASMAVLHGYRKTIQYQIGLAAGVFVLMLISGWFSATLLNIFPSLEGILRFIGAAYILYLAFVILKSTYFFKEESTKSLGMANGFAVQILNPKLTIYAFTLFSTFLSPLETQIVPWIAILLGGVSFCATSVWALFGTAIQLHLQDSRLRMLINILLSLSLMYSALSLAGLI